ncbi:helix-turn-helix transcriptional regulator [Sphingobacterium sp. HJSM2_6]|uniref:helix-turn-helix transcriptional regulator n=1 Tax=Sphingobacterium sp. HJSM2_6 TaxID=3366264 RepID=UPI003BBB8541
MSVELKKRFDRIVHILIHLQSKKVVRAQELADRFEVSLRTIYRDIKSLEQAGVPLIGEAGTGYSIMDGYKLPPVSFSKEEALSFVAAEKIAEKYLDKQTLHNYASAMLKMKAILKSNEQEMVSTVQEQIIMRKLEAPVFLEQVPQVLSSALAAIAQQKQLHILYQGVKDNLAMERTIEPVGIVHELGYWYIVAYCMHRMDYRQFRSDRIQHISAKDQLFTQKHLSIDQIVKKQHPAQAPRIRVIIRCSTQFAPYIRWQRNHYGFKEEILVQDQVEMHFEPYDIDHEFPRWLMMFADQIEIIEPIAIKLYMQSLIIEMKNNLDL